MKVLLSLFTNKIVKMFSQYNTALFPALNYYNSWDHSYCTEMQKAALLMNAVYPFKSTHLHITVSGILIERDCFKMFELLRIWSISQYLANPFSHCKPWLITWSTIVSLILSDMRLCPWPLLPLPLFCLCTLPPCILPPLLSLVYWPWSFPVYKKCFYCSWTFLKRPCIWQMHVIHLFCDKSIQTPQEHHYREQKESDFKRLLLAIGLCSKALQLIGID